jgi:predicted short-subunit dehydrogenase-like oxidoreductase (DUF2520 family)
MEARASEKQPIGIAGTGRIAQAFGRLLRGSGEPVVAVAGRNPERTQAAAVFIGAVKATTLSNLPQFATRILIAVSDEAITEVAATLAAAGMHGGSALHTCGALGPEALDPLSRVGVSCGALHPLQTVATPEQGVIVLRNVSFAVDGEGAALRWAEGIVSLLEGRTLHIRPSHRVLYHAAAVMAANYTVALLDAAVMLMKAAGVAEQEAMEALAPLAQNSLANALTLGPAKALTGPVSRGDKSTIAKHLRALADVPGPTRELYRCAGLQALAVARSQGLSDTKAKAVEEILKNIHGNG